MTNIPAAPDEAAAETSSSASALDRNIALALAGAALKAFGLDEEENSVELTLQPPSSGSEVRYDFSAQNVDRDFPFGNDAAESIRLTDISYGFNEGGYGENGLAVYQFKEIAAIIEWHGSCGEFCDDNCDGYVSGTVQLVPSASAAARLTELRATLLREHAARIVSYLCSGAETFSPVEMGAAVRRTMLDVAVDPRRAAQRAELLNALAAMPAVAECEAET